MRFLLATPSGLLPLAGSETDAPLVGVITGDDVALHRVPLLETTPKRRLAEARMRATDLSAQPPEDLHLAIGDSNDAGNAWLAIIARERMLAHLAHFATHGAEPDSLVPAALLLATPPGQTAAFAGLDDLVLVRNQTRAAATERALAEIVAGQPAPDVLTPFAAAFSTASPLPLDLRQGEFARPVRWWRERAFRIAAAALLLLVTTLAAAPMVIESMRSRTAVAAADRATVEIATRALGKQPADAATGGAALESARRAAEANAIGPRLSFLAASIEQSPAARLDSVQMTPGGRLAITLGGPADAIISIGARLTAGPFNAALAGRALTLGDRRTARASSDAALPVAMARTITAQADAAILRSKTVPPRALPPAAIAEAFAAAGLDIVLAEGAPARIQAARPTVLLPLLADLEAKGARFSTLILTRNDDETLAAEIGFAR